MRMQGSFITFEGGEGAGKTTVLQAVYKEFKEKGKDVITTREPGGIEIAEQIRSVILDTKNDKMDRRTEALLYAAARRQHLVEKVIPNLEQGKIVLCDRFIDSSLAYQGFARGIGMDEILKINQFAIDQFMPDLTLYFDIRPEVGLKRIEQAKMREVNRLDLEKLEFHEKVREGYLFLVERFPKRILVINAEQSQEKVFEEVLDKLDKHFENIR